MKTNLVNILISPITIAIIVTVLIVMLIPAVPKYEVELVEQTISPKAKVYFNDLNGDGYSEKIEFLSNSVGNASFKLYYMYMMLIKTE